jgi:hypothetical protein
MKRSSVIPLLAALLLAVLCAPVLAAEPVQDAGAKLEAQPPSLVIGTFYAGQPVKLSGEIAAGQEVVLEVQGLSENLSFDLKGRVGPFWMNRGLVRVENAPSLYILLLPGQVSGQAFGEDRLQALGLGLAHLKQGAVVHTPGQDPEQMFARFLAFKKEAGLYQQIPGAITYAPAGPGRKSFTAGFDFPSSLAAGQYQVTATVLQDGSALQRLSKTYLVEDGPFLKLVKDLAMERALLFGVLCVLVALVTGGVMGVVFKGGKGGH